MGSLDCLPSSSSWAYVVRPWWPEPGSIVLSERSGDAITEGCLSISDVCLVSFMPPARLRLPQYLRRVAGKPLAGCRAAPQLLTTFGAHTRLRAKSGFSIRSSVSCSKIRNLSIFSANQSPIFSNIDQARKSCYFNILLLNATIAIIVCLTQ